MKNKKLFKGCFIVVAIVIIGMVGVKLYDYHRRIKVLEAALVEEKRKLKDAQDEAKRKRDAEQQEIKNKIECARNMYKQGPRKYETAIKLYEEVINKDENLITEASDMWYLAAMYSGEIVGACKDMEKAKKWTRKASSKSDGSEIGVNMSKRLIKCYK